ncbi:hypothetical protein BB560_006984 [Smittium megazygosporum]|uniref:Uncharacterized protein n=1 Tax=Smittium megazygosporum TaxID=133381 RepID=A0A2T9XZP2_9FUNG|nr:hypothetical protein BB560_006984 [Smittium megazygosporum]
MVYYLLRVPKTPSLRKIPLVSTSSICVSHSKNAFRKSISSISLVLKAHSSQISLHTGRNTRSIHLVSFSRDADSFPESQQSSLSQTKHLSASETEFLKLAKFTLENLYHSDTSPEDPLKVPFFPEIQSKFAQWPGESPAENVNFTKYLFYYSYYSFENNHRLSNKTNEFDVYHPLNRNLLPLSSSIPLVQNIKRSVLSGSIKILFFQFLANLNSNPVLLQHFFKNNAFSYLISIPDFIPVVPKIKYILPQFVKLLSEINDLDSMQSIMTNSIHPALKKFETLEQSDSSFNGSNLVLEIVNQILENPNFNYFLQSISFSDSLAQLLFYMPYDSSHTEELINRILANPHPAPDKLVLKQSHQLFLCRILYHATSLRTNDFLKLFISLYPKVSDPRTERMFSLFFPWLRKITPDFFQNLLEKELVAYAGSFKQFVFMINFRAKEAAQDVKEVFVNNLMGAFDPFTAINILYTISLHKSPVIFYSYLNILKRQFVPPKSAVSFFFNYDYTPIISSFPENFAYLNSEDNTAPLDVESYALPADKIMSGISSALNYHHRSFMVPILLKDIARRNPLSFFSTISRLALINYNLSVGFKKPRSSFVSSILHQAQYHSIYVPLSDQIRDQYISVLNNTGLFPISLKVESNILKSLSANYFRDNHRLVLLESKLLNSIYFAHLYILNKIESTTFKNSICSFIVKGKHVDSSVLPVIRNMVQFYSSNSQPRILLLLLEYVTQFVCRRKNPSQGTGLFLMVCEENLRYFGFSTDITLAQFNQLWELILNYSSILRSSIFKAHVDSNPRLADEKEADFYDLFNYSRSTDYILSPKLFEIYIKGLVNKGALEEAIYKALFLYNKKFNLVNLTTIRPILIDGICGKIETGKNNIKYSRLLEIVSKQFQSATSNSDIKFSPFKSRSLSNRSKRVVDFYLVKNNVY